MNMLEHQEIILPIIALVSVLIWALSRWALTQKKVKESESLTNLFNILSTASISVAKSLEGLPSTANKEDVLNKLVSDFINSLESGSTAIKDAKVHPELAKNLMKSMVHLQESKQISIPIINPLAPPTANTVPL